jgi:hypothetical protein
MLWGKSWLDTRSRFLVGFALLTIAAAGIVFDYTAVVQLLPMVPQEGANGPIGRIVQQAAAVERSYRGFVWWQWYHQNLSELWMLFAILLGSGGLLPNGPDGALFTLSLPASRRRILGVRAGTGLAELLVLAIVPSLMIPLLSPSIGQAYGLGDLLVHGICLFAAGGAFFCLALLLSTIFGDIWRPLLLSCLVAAVLSMAETFLPALSRYGIVTAMAGGDPTQGPALMLSHLPWPGLLISITASVVLLAAASANFARADF